MQDFREKIMKIAYRNKQTRDEGSIAPEPDNLRTSFDDVMNILYGKTELAVNVYNEAARLNRLSLVWLPGELLQVFLNASGNRGGFCLLSDLKLVFFIGMDPDEFIVLGKKRKDRKSTRLNSSHMSESRMPSSA